MRSDEVLELGRSIWSEGQPESRKCQRGRGRRGTAAWEVTLCLLAVSGERCGLTQIEGFIKCRVKYQIQAELPYLSSKSEILQNLELSGSEIMPQVGRPTSKDL